MYRLLTLTLLAFLMSVSSSFAETTDWMPRREYENYTLKLKARKMLPTRIQCRPGKNGVPYEVKLTSVPNKEKNRVASTCLSNIGFPTGYGGSAFEII